MRTTARARQSNVVSNLPMSLLQTSLAKAPQKRRDLLAEKHRAAA